MGNLKKISLVQAVFLLLICRLLTAYAYLPILTTPPANQDMWIVVILSILYTFLICIPLLFLNERFINISFFKYTEKICGKFFGKLIVLLYSIFLFFYSALQLTIVKDFLGATIMPETPAYATTFLMVITCTYIIYKGINSLCRIAEIFVPYIILTILIFTVLNIKEFDMNVFLPTLSTSSFYEINYGALSIASRFSEVIILSMMACHFKKENDFRRAFFLSVTLFSFLFLIIVVSTHATLGIQIAKESNFPFFAFTKRLELLDFIERVESLNIVAWFIGAFIKYSVYMYFATIGLSNIFNTTSNKVFIIPLSIILYIVTLFWVLKRSVVGNHILSYEVLPYINFVFILVIPLCIMIIYGFRDKHIIK